MKRFFKLFIVGALLGVVAAFSGCSIKDTIDQAKCKHDYGATATKVVKVATCTEKGEELWTCRKCKKEKTEKTDKLDHVFKQDKVVKVATCTAQGEVLFVCELCDAQKTEVSAKLPHNRIDVDAVEATCDKEGFTDYAYCADCNTFIYPKTIVPAKGHLPVPIEGYAATCTEDGLTYGSYCTRCDTVLTEQEKITATGHVVTTVEGYAATCGKDGLTDGSKCSACDTVFNAQEVIPATGDHTIVTVEGYAATCTEDGLTDGSKCSVCDTVLTEQETIAATGHTLGEDSKCALCGELNLDYFADRANYTATAPTEDELVFGNVYRLYKNSDAILVISAGVDSGTSLEFTIHFNSAGNLVGEQGTDDEYSYGVERFAYFQHGEDENGEYVDIYLFEVSLACYDSPLGRPAYYNITAESVVVSASGGAYRLDPK